MSYEMQSQGLGLGNWAAPSIDVGAARILIANAHRVSTKHIGKEKDFLQRLETLKKPEKAIELEKDIHHTIEEIKMILPTVPAWPEKQAWAFGSFLFLVNADLLHALQSFPAALWQPITTAMHLVHPDVWTTATALALITQQMEGQDCILQTLNSLRSLFSPVLFL